MKPLVRAAPDGVRAAWFVSDDGTLIIEVSDKLDKVTRQRYIQQALDEHGIEPHRRLAIPLIFGTGALGAHRTVRQHVAAGAIASGVVATGVTAALILPGMLGGNPATINHPRGTPPAAVQPTPPHSGPVLPPPRRAQPVSRTVPPSPTAAPATPLPRTPTYIPVSPPAAGPRLRPPIVRRVQPVTGPLPVPLPPHLPPPLPMPLPHPQPAACLLDLNPLIHAGALCSQALIMRSP